jgi:uncharacterized phage protein gp47/JayE
LNWRLLKVFSSVDAGIYHELSGDLDFLARQLFSDTADGAYLREHSSGWTPPLCAAPASGDVLLSGQPDKSVPAGVVFKSAAGKTYYTEVACKLDGDGAAAARVKSQNLGLTANLAVGEELNIISAIPTGINSKAVAAAGDITGGAHAESDEEYLARATRLYRAGPLAERAPAAAFFKTRHKTQPRRTSKNGGTVRLVNSQYRVSVPSGVCRPFAV